MHMGREPMNVQVIVQQPTKDSPKREVCLFLVYETGIILRRGISTHNQSDSKSLSNELSVSVSSKEEIKTLQEELAQVKEQLAAENLQVDATESELALARADKEIDWLKEELQKVKETL